MSALMQEMSAKALKLGIPLSVQLDLTYRCNEKCIHCYLDHEDHGEMTTAEIKNLLDQLAEAGVFFLTLSGGEILLRKDFFEILEYARALRFCVKLKTNAVLIRRAQAERIRILGVNSVQISIYSHRPEVHDAITKVPGSLKRSVAAIRFLKATRVEGHHCECLDASKYPGLSGCQGTGYGIGRPVHHGPDNHPEDGWGPVHPGSERRCRPPCNEVFRDENLVGNVEEFCAPPKQAEDDDLDVCLAARATRLLRFALR